MIDRIGSLRRHSADGSPIRFDASDFTERFAGLTATMSVYCDDEGHRGLITTERLSIVSGNDRKQFAARLHQHPNAKPLQISHDTWAGLVEAACLDLLADQQRLEELIELDGLRPPLELDRYLYEPLLLSSAVPTAIFGEGGSGKSWLAQAIAASVASGQSFVTGLNAPSKQVPVLWLDWENDPPTMRERMSLLTGGFPMEGIKYLRMLRPLHEQVDQIAAQIERHGFGLVVIDSVTGAAGADLNDNKTATQTHAAIRQLGVPSLLIAHTAKNTKGAGIFGAVAWRDLSRLVWSIEQSATDTGYVRLRDTKRNSTVRSADLGVRLAFDRDDEGLPTLVLSVASSDDLPVDLPKVVPVPAQILSLLQAQPLSRTGLAEVVDATPEALRKALQRLQGSGAITKWDDGKYSIRGTRDIPSIYPVPDRVTSGGDGHGTTGQMSHPDSHAGSAFQGDQ